ncbi:MULTISPECIES: translation factor GTPase family protein [unclassified Streptomyces]|uniref:elongation factor G n=1 Tax=unclassified Streptomyces TaxID=2593676 RepID=UPI001BEA64D8|nr:MULTISPECIES: TetM/TetW/TetO/TetS family tetracycline resistance ribosomal protection protein [unclassified Streptomyces]MBT2408580.1 TetM/TetW/TetO/TetS family tetracycline resistance ribosomal protection protein [Streptomyces sp. ISL-21]MBT2608736.1 TetM/TetW/TetO/TetS family tetracycline resistance ribosomal protection protein [Streptomyces sp. ISL-87]
MTSVNIGILAHVDAGKTSLTERLLYTAGVIDRIGSVDRGDTQTDAHELERRRGITIRSAVVSFTVGEVKVNLIDTPGHPDFISEVERALGVLDGVVLVISAVEGVQAQSRLLMRTLVKMRMPVILFVNKIDRMGARYEDLLESIRSELAPSLVPMTRVEEIGTRQAHAVARRVSEEDFASELTEVLAEHDDGFLARYLADEPVLVAQDYATELARQTREALLCPVFFGSAVAGTGITGLIDGITSLLPVAPGRSDAGLRGTVFKIERGWAGEKVAYVRLHSGVLRARTNIGLYRQDRHGTITELAGRPTVVEVFHRGSEVIEAHASAGDIAKVRGLKGIRIGDQLGTGDGLRGRHLFAPPSLETVIRATRPGAMPDLYEALLQLADQDPFINVRKNDDEQEVSVSLYGEVQKEVIKATLAEDYKLDVEFEGTRTICVERPIGVGESVEEIDLRNRTFFWATVGLRVEPGEPDSGVVFRRSVELGSLPHAFHKAIEEAVRSTLQQGLYGWEVLDILVTLTRTGYASPVSAAGDFRKVTPLVLMDALKQAGTQVFEPVNRFELEVPAENISTALLNLVECGATPETTKAYGSTCLVDGTIPARTVQEFEQRLPGLSQGEGILSTRLDSFQPAPGPAPARRRTDTNPMDRKEYLLRVFGRI